MSKLTYSRTEKDFLNFSGIVQSKRNSSGFTIFLLATILIGFVVYDVLQDILHKIERFPANIFIEVFLSCAWFYGIFYLCFRVYKAVDKRKWFTSGGYFLSQKTLRMTANGIDLEAGYNKGFVDWRGIIVIQDTPDYILFYIDRGQAHMVPKTAFENADAVGVFLEQAHSYWQKTGEDVRVKKKPSKVAFTLTEEDFLKYSDIINKKSALGRVRYRLYTFGICVVSVVLLNELIGLVETTGYFPANAFVKAVVWILIIIVVFGFACHYFMFFYTRSLLARDGNFLSRKTFQMTTKGIEEKSIYYSVFTDWRGVTDIQETKEYILFYLDDLHAYVVPKSAFKKPEDVAAFREKAYRFWQNASGCVKEEKDSKIGKYVTFVPLEQDFRKLKHILDSQRWSWGGFIITVSACVISLVLCWVLFDVLRSSNYTVKFTPLVVLAFFVFFELMSRFFRAFSKYSYLYPQGAFLAVKTVKIDTRGVSVESENYKGSSRWHGVFDIQETKEYLLFYIDRLQAYQVPKTAFETPEDATAFLDRARGYWRKAGGGAVMKKGKK